MNAVQCEEAIDVTYDYVQCSKTTRYVVPGTTVATRSCTVEHHTPIHTTKCDKYGEYDEIRCVRCGILMLGSFV